MLVDGRAAYARKRPWSTGVDVSDRSCSLIAEVKRLADCERGATVDLIVHLAELDRRRLNLPLGYSSL
jgi:hypothetical protein